ncbi:hypothetical protein RFI_22846 [Reticulomyxa filosa]|uniref:Uncharacterized protein n=1 Tax=Reticulomyxa filosa TaxID=46433 RepID=X6MM58_RETFI|nr:hypothetical protein RFI_22846 [Reticulomyxa filosa]|eukprot:ETO14522.1 hypothetical protein RFI_22846 [Reticulomyxa filosa]
MHFFFCSLNFFLFLIVQWSNIHKKILIFPHKDFAAFCSIFCVAMKLNQILIFARRQKQLTCYTIFLSKPEGAIKKNMDYSYRPLVRFVSKRKYNHNQTKKRNQSLIHAIVVPNLIKVKFFFFRTVKKNDKQENQKIKCADKHKIVKMSMDEPGKVEEKKTPGSTDEVILKTSWRLVMRFQKVRYAHKNKMRYILKKKTDKINITLLPFTIKKNDTIKEA